MTVITSYANNSQLNTLQAVYEPNNNTYNQHNYNHNPSIINSDQSIIFRHIPSYHININDTISNSNQKIYSLFHFSYLTKSNIHTIIELTDKEHTY